jgi:hypothetical protein
MSDHVEVNVQPDRVVVVLNAPEFIEIVDKGPQGEPGPIGADGETAELPISPAIIFRNALDPVV